MTNMDHLSICSSRVSLAIILAFFIDISFIYRWLLCLLLFVQSLHQDHHLGGSCIPAGHASLLCDNLSPVQGGSTSPVVMLKYLQYVTACHLSKVGTPVVMLKYLHYVTAYHLSKVGTPVVMLKYLHCMTAYHLSKVGTPVVTLK